MQNFVDLAGSERLLIHDKPEQCFSTPSKREEIEKRAKGHLGTLKKECKNINKSLFFLTQVISLRGQNKS